MARTIQVIFEVRTDDEGDVTYRVEARHGSSGEIPPYHVLHHSHSHSSARTRLHDAANAAVRGALAELTCPNDQIPSGAEIK